MKRPVRAASIFVLALALSSAAGAEEQADGVPARSFTALQPLLTPGERLIIRDGSGRTTHGRLVSLSGDELEIKRRRWNLRTERRAWTEGTVERIQHEDSTWEGKALGAAIGVAVLAIMNPLRRIETDACNALCAPFIVAAVPVGATIGGAIDGSINDTLYEPRVVSRFGTAPASGLRPGIVLSYRLSLAR
jgi:hypothetical protein